jgi:hypothetical protein
MLFAGENITWLLCEWDTLLPPPPKLARSASMSQKNFFCKNSNWVSSNAKFDTDFEYFEKSVKIFTQKSYRPITFAHSDKSQTPFFHYFLVKNFFRMHFYSF